MGITASGFTNQDGFAPDRLFAGEYPRVDRKVTIADSVALTRGAVLGRVTADGKYLLVDDTAVDGSEVADAILAEDADANGQDAEALVYLTGEFNEDALTFGGDDTADDHRQSLRERGIFLKKTQPAAA